MVPPVYKISMRGEDWGAIFHGFVCLFLMVPGLRFCPSVRCAARTTCPRSLTHVDPKKCVHPSVVLHDRQPGRGGSRAHRGIPWPSRCTKRTPPAGGVPALLPRDSPQGHSLRNAPTPPRLPERTASLVLRAPCSAWRCAPLLCRPTLTSACGHRRPSLPAASCHSASRM